MIQKLVQEAHRGVSLEEMESFYKEHPNICELREYKFQRCCNVHHKVIRFGFNLAHEQSIDDFTSHFTRYLMVNVMAVAETLEGMAKNKRRYTLRFELDAINHTNLADGTEWCIVKLPLLGIEAGIYTHREDNGIFFDFTIEIGLL